MLAMGLGVTALVPTRLGSLAWRGATPRRRFEVLAPCGAVSWRAAPMATSAPTPPERQEHGTTEWPEPIPIGRSVLGGLVQEAMAAWAAATQPHRTRATPPTTATPHNPANPAAPI